MTRISAGGGATTRPTLTLGSYVRHRNGVPLGASGALRNMMDRSLGAKSFAAFWRYWNPVFGYGLGRYVFNPLKAVLPAAPALVVTFIVSGALHDAVTMAVSGSVAFLFTPWFFFLSLGVLAGSVAGMDLSSRPWGVRATVNLAYLAAGLLLALLVRTQLAF